jgi:hypothetical protein
MTGPGQATGSLRVTSFFEGPAGGRLASTEWVIHWRRDATGTWKIDRIAWVKLGDGAPPL